MLTSRRSHWCTIKRNGGCVGVQEKNPVGIELFFSCKNLLLLKEICFADEHVSESDAYSESLDRCKKRW